MHPIKLSALAVVVAVALAPSIAAAKSYARHSGSTTSYYSKGKPVGKAVTHGNTTTYYQRGKPVGKSIRR